MSRLISLYNELAKRGIRFYAWDMGDLRAATIEMDGRFGIFMDPDNIQTDAEALVVLAHEGGHASTGATHKVCSPYDLVEKHENKADKWAITQLISVDELDEAVADGHTDLWDLADHFGVTKDFMRKVVCWYTHGNLAVDEYMNY